MDPRPIGVFDSGLGGLTAVRQLRRVLPGEDIVYFGDTGRVPYGSRGRDIIVQYARQDIRFLLQQDVKFIIACLRYGVLDLSARGSRRTARAVHRRGGRDGPRGSGCDPQQKSGYHRHGGDGAQRVLCGGHPRHDARGGNFRPGLPDVRTAGGKRLFQRRQPGHKAHHCGVSAGAEGRGR